MSEFSLIQNKLLSDEGMNLVHAAITTADILNYYDTDVKKAIVDWANGKDVSSFEADGNTVFDIIDELGCTSFMALCILNAIKKNPESFEDAILMLGEDTIL